MVIHLYPPANPFLRDRIWHLLIAEGCQRVCEPVSRRFFINQNLFEELTFGIFTKFYFKDMLISAN